MKKIITILVLSVGVAASVFGQSKKEDDSNCYIKWAQKFEQRGADDIVDGVYTDVIITFRNGSDATCFDGKCEVKEGKVKAMFIKVQDNTYEEVKKKLRYPNDPVTITNGMSKTSLTMEDELINVLFIKKLKPKKAGYVKAPDPTDD